MNTNREPVTRLHPEPLPLIDLIGALDYAAVTVRDDDSLLITSVFDNPATIVPGSLFVAIKLVVADTQDLPEKVSFNNYHFDMAFFRPFYYNHVCRFVF